MDPRNTSGYRLHYALTDLNRIEVAQFDDADQDRIETARRLLTQLESGGDADF